MTERAKRLCLHLAWGALCVALTRYAIGLRIDAERNGLARLFEPDYDQRQRMRTLAEFIHDSREAHALALAVTDQKDFRVARLSGSRVVALAESALRKAGDDLSVSGDAHISIRKEEGRLVWDVTFYSVPGAPGMFGTVTVDDLSEACTITPGL